MEEILSCMVSPPVLETLGEEVLPGFTRVISRIFSHLPARLSQDTLDLTGRKMEVLALKTKDKAASESSDFDCFLFF